MAAVRSSDRFTGSMSASAPVSSPKLTRIRAATAQRTEGPERQRRISPAASAPPRIRAAVPKPSRAAAGTEFRTGTAPWGTRGAQASQSAAARGGGGGARAEPPRGGRPPPVPARELPRPPHPAEPSGGADRERRQQ